MFIYSMRGATLRFVAVAVAALTVLSALMFLVPVLTPSAPTAGLPAGESTTSIRYDGVRDNKGRVEFLRQFGWEVEETPTESATVTIPREFDKIFAAYNELQRRQGLDLTPFAARKVERYTYTVKNFDGATGRVFANLLVYRGRVIGGDICSAEGEGFLKGFQK